MLLNGCAGSTKSFVNRPPSLQVGAAALAGGAPEAALSVARRQLAINRDDLGALLIEGQALTEMGEMAQAEGSFRRALRVSSSSTGAQFGLGRVLLLSGRAPDAEAAFRRVLASSPRDPRALTNLGISLDMQETSCGGAGRRISRRSEDLARAGCGAGQPWSFHGTWVGMLHGGVEVLRPLAASPSCAAPRSARPGHCALALSG